MENKGKPQTVQNVSLSMAANHKSSYLESFPPFSSISIRQHFILYEIPMKAISCKENYGPGINITNDKK